MFNKYIILNTNNEEELILFIDFNYEMGSFNNRCTSIKKSIKEFIKNKKIKFNGKKVILAVGGILLATVMLNNNDITFDKFNNEDLIQYVDSSSFNLINDVPKIDDIKEIKTVQKNLIDNTKTKNTSSNDKVKNLAKKEIKKSTTKTTKKSSYKKSSTKKSVESNAINQTQVKNVTEKVTIYRKSGNVETLDLEEYVIGVVAAEMPASFNEEAIKAQAILARTYALKSKKTGKKITDTVSTQSYIDIYDMKSKWGNDYTKYYNKIKKCVDLTKGIYITYNGEIIDAVYHSTSNGMTEDAIEVWGYSVPYLKSVNSGWDSKTSSYKREVSKDKYYILNIFGINSLDEISIISRNSSGRVSKVRVGDHVYSGINIREMLGLRSADFDFKISDDKLIIITKGYGHGVGMSQYGANEMAKSGKTYKEIILHYYKNVKIVTK